VNPVNPAPSLLASSFRFSSIADDSGSGSNLSSDSYPSSDGAVAASGFRLEMKSSSTETSPNSGGGNVSWID
jgi:hypothetical protein